MKILFIAENLTYGGVAHRFIELANALTKRDFDITLYVYNGDIQIKDKLNKEIKCVVEKFENESGLWLYRNIIYRCKCIKKINNFISKNNFDIIISFNDMVNINLLLCKEAYKSKIIISERSDPNYNKKYLQIIKKLLFKMADGIVFQTDGAKEFFGYKIKKKSAVIPNPIPSYNIENIHRGNPDKRIVSVARFWIYQKRQDILIKSFSRIVDKYPEYKLVLYGDGPDEKIIKELVKSLNLENNVEFAGVSNDIITSIKTASLFILTSDFEGIPNALIEAMTIGIPVISTDCSPGGAKLLIENNENGILVPCSDIDALTDAIEYMINNPEKAQKMGKKATEIATRFEKEKIYDLWMVYIKNIIKEK